MEKLILIRNIVFVIMQIKKTELELRTNIFLKSLIVYSY